MSHYHDYYLVHMLERNGYTQRRLADETGVHFANVNKFVREGLPNSRLSSKVMEITGLTQPELTDALEALARLAVARRFDRIRRAAIAAA